MDMSQSPQSPESPETKEDLRKVLMQFWLQTMEESKDAEYPERMKASELLAKYFLSEGRTAVTRKPTTRPSTSEILQQARDLEEEPYSPPPPQPFHRAD